MQDRPADIESRLAAIERRLAALEGESGAAAQAAGTAPEPSLDDDFLSTASGHVGRVLLIFGGAYLLRAITDFNFVPIPVGLAMGAVYALFWLFMAWRKSGIDTERALATFYGATSVLLALPLLVESVSHFGLLSGAQGITGLVIYTGLALSVATTRRLLTLAWVAVAGAVVTAFAILVVAHVAVLAAGFLLVLGTATLWIAYSGGLRGPQWLGAFGADAGVVALTVFAGHEQWAVSATAAGAAGMLLLLVYLGSFVLRSHWLKQDIGVFEILQALLASALLLGILLATDVEPAPGGSLAAALGLVAWGLAVAPATRERHTNNFYFYAGLGLLLVLAGSALALAPETAAIVWAALAVLLAFASGRTGWVVLSLESTILVIAAGVGSGLLAVGWQALTGDAAADWPTPGSWLPAIALATVACLFVPIAQHSERWGAFAGAPQLVTLALSVWEVGGLIVLVLAAMLADAGQADVDEGILAAIRTSVLSVAAVTLALSSRHRRWPEARWLVYPVLVLVGLKLFIEDFPIGRPETLFVALAFVGSALIAVARLLRKGGSANPQPVAPVESQGDSAKSP